MLYAAGRELPGGDVIVPGGLASVLDTILNLLPDNVIQTGSLVSNIDWSAGDIVVTTDTGVCWDQDLSVTLNICREIQL